MPTMVAESNVALVRVFIILQMIGCFSFAFMIFSALVFPSVRRHPVWYNFCLSWVMFSLSYSLLSFAGQQFTLSSQTICKAQAAMVYAAPFLAGGSSIALVLQLLLNILAVLSHSPVKRSFPIISFSSIVVPWVMWTAIVIGVVVLIEQNPQLVSISHNGTFCIVIRSPVPRLTAIAAAVSSIAIVALEVVISYLLYRHRAIKDIFRQSLAMAVRVFIFTAVAMTAAVIGMIFASTKERVVIFDVMIATIPVSTAVIFGTQMDLWEGYKFWKRPCGRSSTEHDSILTTMATMTVVSQRMMSIRRGSTSSSGSPCNPIGHPMATAA